MKSSSRRGRFLIWLGIFALCAVSFGAGLGLNAILRTSDEHLLLTAFRTVSRDSIYNQSSSRELSYAAIRGMLASIDDPYAELIEPQAAENFTSTFMGQTGVVGLYAEKKNNRAVVSIVFPNGSAEKAGIRVGDALVAIGDVTLDSDTDSSETGLMLRGLPGTSVRVQVQRDDQILMFDLLRQEREFVTIRMLSDGVGYISLSAYNQVASQQMKEKLAELIALKPVALIWDLRNNEGGDMQAAQEILSYFIKDGLLFSAELTHDRRVQFRANGKTIAADIPLVVLMDKTTYSAAETSAAAVAETGRGTTVGTHSYGKGVIQATIPLPEDNMLQMTIAKWRSPSGEWYQDRGVAPQIEAVDNPDTEVDELLQAGVDFLMKK